MPDKNYAGNSGLSSVFAAIKASINEKVDKIAGKGLVNQNVENMLCDKTNDGTYVLKATVSNGNITYSWELE